MSDETDELAWWMNSIARTTDDQEIWGCEGAIAELAFYRDHDAETDEDRAQTQRIISALSHRRERVIEAVRGGDIL